MKLYEWAMIKCVRDQVAASAGPSWEKICRSARESLQPDGGPADTLRAKVKGI